MKRKISPPTSSDEDSKPASKKAKQDGKRKMTESVSEESTYGRHKKITVDNTAKSRALSTGDNGRKGKPTTRERVGNRVKNKIVSPRKVTEDDGDNGEISDEEIVKQGSNNGGKKGNWRNNIIDGDSEEGLDKSGEVEDDEDGSDVDKDEDGVEENEDEEDGDNDDEGDGENDDEDGDGDNDDEEDEDDVDEENEDEDIDECEVVDEGEEIDESEEIDEDEDEVVDEDEEFDEGSGEDEDEVDGESEDESTEEDSNKSRTKSTTAKRGAPKKVTARVLRSRVKK